MGYKTVIEDDIDVLIAGAGMAGTGAAFESRYWGKDMKIVIAEKANIDRSGAVAQGLYAINTYMGTRFGENNPEDHVRYARMDLMGMVREDLLFDMARHVDSAVHQFEEWGLPLMRDPKTGAYQREGRWQIMIHGESYKPIVAEAAKNAIADAGYDPQYGARPLKRVIQQQLANPLASELLRIGSNGEEKTITVDHDGNHFVFTT